MKRHVAIMYAVDSSGQKILAQKGLRAHCDFCKSEVIAKCGEINRWHWAHTSNSNCDSWAEGETDWHLYWKGLVPKANVERVIQKDGIIHRADILTDEGCVVELQHSPISVEDIRDRENFYGNMVWLFDIRAASSRLQGIGTQNPNWMPEEVYDWLNKCCRNYPKKQTFPEGSEWRSLSFWQDQCEKLIKHFPQMIPKKPQRFGEMVPLWEAAPRQLKFKSRRLLYPGLHHFFWKNPRSHIAQATKTKFLHAENLNGIGDAIFEVTNVRLSSFRFDGIARPKQHMESWLKEKCRGSPPVVSI